LFRKYLPVYLGPKVTLWLQVCGKSGAILGVALVLISHSVRAKLGLNTRLPGLMFLAAGLFLYALYAERKKRIFGTTAAVALAVLTLFMIYEQLARPRVSSCRTADAVGILIALGAVALAIYHEKQ